MAFHPDLIRDLWRYQDQVNRAVAKLFEEQSDPIEQERQLRRRLGLLHVLEAFTGAAGQVANFSVDPDGTNRIEWAADIYRRRTDAFDVVGPQPTATPEMPSE